MTADRLSRTIHRGELDLFERMPQLGWVADPDGFIRYYNHQWHAYTGTTPEQMEGWGWQAVHHPEVLPEVLERWNASIATEAPFEMSFPLRRHDGEFRWFLTRAVPVKDESGKVLRWVGINTDVDDQKKAADALADAVKVREGLLAMVSHDLRNPMNAALMAASQIEFLAEPGHAGDRFRKSADVIKRAIDRMTRLVSDLLDLSRLEAQRPISVDLEANDVVKIAVQTIESLEPLVVARKLRFETELAPAPVWTMCDVDRIRQVIENLVGNAIKFTREGGVVALSVRKEGSDAVFCIRDSGIGIAEDQLPHIFSAYWQADTKGQRGVGLGLAIVKAIVDAHDGRVWAESQANVGTAFYFTVPLIDTPPTPAEDGG